MLKRTTRFLNLMITITLLVSLLTPYGVTYAEEANTTPAAISDILDTEKVHSDAVDNFSHSSGLNVHNIQSYLDTGLTLEELEQAAKETKSGVTLEQAIPLIKPDIVNLSLDAKSIITSDTTKDFSTTSFVTMAATKGDYSYVNTKPDEAPYKVSLDQETLSTLTGSLSLQATDITLPGRNGLSFSLTRSYDSSSAQFGQLGFKGGQNSAADAGLEEKTFPIGKGWSWNLNFIEKQEGKKYLHLANGGTYEISDKVLKGYPWKDLSMATDNSVTVNGEASTDVLISISGLKQYFNAEGRLLLVKDLYGNTIEFSYISDPVYGKVLSYVKDAIGNTISIAYSTTSVKITTGNKKVTYYKTQKNGKELLSQVIDSSGRAVTYNYDIRTAKFNLIGTTPNTDNPYALLTSITHPTGAKTEYTYEGTGTTRFIGENSVNQVFRVTSRQDRILFSDGSFKVYRKKNIAYTGDVGSEYAKDLVFSVAVTDGTVTTTFSNEKDYIDSSTPPLHYNISAVAQAGNLQRVTNYTYDRARKWYYPVATKFYTKNILTGEQSSPAVSTTNYDDYANVTTRTDPMGGRVESSYDPNTHWLSSTTQYITDAQQKYTAYAYNEKGSITQVQVRDSNKAGTLLQQVGYLDFDKYGNPQRIDTLDGQRTLTTRLEYGADAGYAFPTRQFRTATNIMTNKLETITQQYQYDKSTGSLIRYLDGKQLPTSYEYDWSNRLTKAIHADGTSITIQYDDFNNVLTQIDETGVTSIAKYNSLGMKIETGIIENGIYKAKTKFGYNTQGQLDWSEDALGNRNTFFYDDWGRVKEQRAADGSKSLVDYNDILNTKTSTDAELNSVRETYDLNGRTIKKEQVLGSKTLSIAYTYDKAGQIRTLKDANQETTTYRYNSIGQLTSVVNSLQEETQYTYNMLGNLTHVMYPDKVVMKKEYDELGRLVKSLITNSGSEGDKELIAYDANGNRTKLIDKKGQVFTYAYHSSRDWLLTKKVDGKNDTVTYDYDAAGRRTSMTDLTGTSSYEYVTGTGQLEKMIYPDGRSIQYAYDAAGNKKLMSDPFGGNHYYGYDNLNRLSSVSSTAQVQDAEATYSYFKNGLLKSIYERNGVMSNYEYEGSRLKKVDHIQKNGALLNSYSYVTDNNGNITKRTENGDSVDFVYDKLNRVEASAIEGLSYKYDSRGNRSKMISFDAAESPIAEYIYDSRDQLTNVKLTTGEEIAYKYNGDGLLYERTENQVTTRYYYDGRQVIAEATVVKGTAVFKARYIRGAGLIAREDAAQQKAYYLHNGHGDVVELRSSDGLTQVNTYTYDIWGNPKTEIENVSNPFRYSGELWDSTTKLQYLRARWYDPSLGRFINKDRYEGDIANPLSLNLYTYVSNNPLGYIDPTGHWQEGDEKLNQNVQTRIKVLTKQWEQASGDPDRQDKIHREAELLRGLDKLFTEEFPLKEKFGVYNTTQAFDKIKENDAFINLSSKATNVSKEMISAVLYREMRCFAPDDAFDPYKVLLKGDASLGLGQIFIGTARKSDIVVFGESSLTNSQYFDLLASEDTNIMYVGIVLKAEAITLNIDPSTSDPRLLKAYNGAQSYADATIKYVRLFEAYYTPK